MPELPEVETVKNALKKKIQKEDLISRVSISKKRLRFSYPKKLRDLLLDQKVYDIHRRAKYLLFDLGDFYLVNHLGMTGTWRQDNKATLHDHFSIDFVSGNKLIYNDPRRFGFFDYINKVNWENTKFFSHLGPEPLDTKFFNSSYLLLALKNKKAPIKNVIMDQAIVVGVGNIYASEALFKARINPFRSACSLNKYEVALLVKEIRNVLKAAIRSGGSYIRDFKSLEGAASFQHHFLVYDRKDQACKVCDAKIERGVMAGRATYYCGYCQK